MGRDCFGLGRDVWQDGVRRLPPCAPVHPPSPFLIALVLIARPVPPVRSSSLVCNQSQLVPSLSMMEPRGSSQRDCAKYRSHRPLPASPVRAGSLPFGAARTRDDVAVTVDMRTL